MKDLFGRKIDYMRISITDRCNLRCSYCMPAEGVKWIPSQDILTFEEIERVCRQAVKLGITKFKITGGEPLVRLGCPALIKMIRNIPGVCQITLTTNGILLENYLEELVDAGLDAVNISLDTLDRQKYKKITRFDRLHQVINSIEAAEKSKLKVKINAVLQRDVNVEEWDALLQLSRIYDLDVRFIELMPIGYGAQSKMVSNEKLFQWIQQKYGTMKPDTGIHGNGPAVYYRIEGFKGSVGFISAIHGKFCGECNRIRMTSTGEIKPCLCYGDSFDIRSTLRNCTNEADLSESSENDMKIRSVLERAIKEKPKMHCFEKSDSITENREMAKIGG